MSSVINRQGKPLSKEESGAKHHDIEDLTQKEPTEKAPLFLYNKNAVCSVKARNNYNGRTNNIARGQLN